LIRSVAIILKRNNRQENFVKRHQASTTSHHPQTPNIKRQKSKLKRRQEAGVLDASSVVSSSLLIEISFDCSDSLSVGGPLWLVVFGLFP
jgi:hypothetical protein